MAIIAVTRRIRRVPTSFTSTFIPRPPALATVYLDDESPHSSCSFISANRKRSHHDHLDGAKTVHFSDDFKLRRTDAYAPNLASLRGKRSIDEVHWVDIAASRPIKVRRLLPRLDPETINDEAPEWHAQPSPSTEAVEQTTTGNKVVEEQVGEAPNIVEANSSVALTEVNEVDSSSTASAEVGSKTVMGNLVVVEQVLEALKEIEADATAAATAAATEVNDVNPDSAASSQVDDSTDGLAELTEANLKKHEGEGDDQSGSVKNEDDMVDSDSDGSTTDGSYIPDTSDGASSTSGDGASMVGYNFEDDILTDPWFQCYDQEMAMEADTASEASFEEEDVYLASGSGPAFTLVDDDEPRDLADGDDDAMDVDEDEYDDDEDVTSSLSTREGPFAALVPMPLRDSSAPTPAFYSTDAVAAVVEATPSLWERGAPFVAAGPGEFASAGSSSIFATSPRAFGMVEASRAAAAAPARLDIFGFPSARGLAPAPFVAAAHGPLFAPARGFTFASTAAAFGRRT
ncbi:hypothetical protein JCM8208_006505 [Rhodotorula glutinis]